MLATKQSFELPAGDTRTLVFTVKSDDEIDVGAAVVDWWLAKAVTSTGDDILLRKSTADAGTAVRFVYVGGVLTLYVDLFEDDTKDVEPGLYYHESRVLIPDVLRDTIASGSVKILPTLIDP